MFVLLCVCVCVCVLFFFFVFFFFVLFSGSLKKIVSERWKENNKYCLCLLDWTFYFHRFVFHEYKHNCGVSYCDDAEPFEPSTVDKEVSEAKVRLVDFPTVDDIAEGLFFLQTKCDRRRILLLSLIIEKMLLLLLLLVFVFVFFSFFCFCFFFFLHTMSQF